MISPHSAGGSVKLRKPVEALVMVPRSHKLSPLSRKMYNVLLHISQSTLRSMQGIPPANFLFEAPLPEILEVCGAATQRTRARQVLTEMRKTDVVWDSPDSTSELQHIGFSLLSECRISKRSGGVTWVHWALPPSLYEALSDPERWATIDLIVLARLSSYAAIVLYEICTKYRENPSHVTCRKEPAWWIELLSATPIPIDPNTGVRKIREWRKFKDEFIQDAILEINSESDLTVELLEDRGGGRSVKTVQFSVKIKKATVAVEAVTGAEIHPGVVKFANRLGITQRQELETMAKAHGEIAVVKALQVLEERQKQTALPLVKSPSGYMRHLLAEKMEIVQEVLAPKPMPSATAILKKSSVNEIPMQVAPLPDSPKVIWTKNLHEEILQEILLLTEEELRKLLNSYAESLRAINMLPATTARRIARLDWCSGVVKPGVIRFYGLAKRGEGWNVPPHGITD